MPNRTVDFNIACNLLSKYISTLLQKQYTKRIVRAGSGRALVAQSPATPSFFLHFSLFLPQNINIF